MNSLLILEDDLNLNATLNEEFRELGYQTFSFTELDSWIASDTKVFDFAIIDMRLGKDLGLKAIPDLIKANDKIGIVVLTGYGSIATAVQAIKLGAKAYLIKPSKVETILKALQGLTKADGGTRNLGHNPANGDERDLKMPSLADVERNYIDYVLEQHQGNKSRAAEILGIPRQSLQRKLKKFTFFRRKP